MRELAYIDGLFIEIFTKQLFFDPNRVAAIFNVKHHTLMNYLEYGCLGSIASVALSNGLIRECASELLL